MTDSVKAQENFVVGLDQLVDQSLPRWDVPSAARARLINVSENATYLVTDGAGFKSILRVHRPNYHSRRAIECELAWSKALGQEGGVATPAFFAGRDGEPIQTVSSDVSGEERHMVMFAFVDGSEPDPDQDLVQPFEQLGRMAALAHDHSIRWRKPSPFVRPRWVEETVFGGSATWGDWRAAPRVDWEIRGTLERLETTVLSRLRAFGKPAESFGLIHADMRLANLLIHDDAEPRLIDFDDCGFGWFLYDFAASISFMEDHPQVPALKQAWIRGYRTKRTLRAADEREIDTFVMFRRMALLAWIGSHIEVETARQLAPTFAEATAKLAEAYLHDLV